MSKVEDQTEPLKSASRHSEHCLSVLPKKKTEEQNKRCAPANPGVAQMRPSPQHQGRQTLTHAGSGRLGSFLMIIFFASSRFFSLRKLSSASFFSRESLFICSRCHIFLMFFICDLEITSHLCKEHKDMHYLQQRHVLRKPNLGEGLVCPTSFSFCEST